MADKKKINVLIDGRNFTIIGNSSKEYVYQIASHVDDRIKEMTDKNSRLSGSMAATLAAINIADDYYKTNIELESLKSKSKAPMEEHDSLIGQLEEAKGKIEELEKKLKDNNEEVLNTKKENEKLLGANESYDQALELKEKELKDSQNMIKKLQDKIFDNQMELIETKKELDESIKLYDDEKNVFTKEEV